jgi:hypothetical protein
MRPAPERANPPKCLEVAGATTSVGKRFRGHMGGWYTSGVAGGTGGPASPVTDLFLLRSETEAVETVWGACRAVATSPALRGQPCYKPKQQPCEESLLSNADVSRKHKLDFAPQGLNKEIASVPIPVKRFVKKKRDLPKMDFTPQGFNEESPSSPAHFGMLGPCSFWPHTPTTATFHFMQFSKSDSYF